jgi:hypothetical protein
LYRFFAINSIEIVRIAAILSLKAAILSMQISGDTSSPTANLHRHQLRIWRVKPAISFKMRIAVLKAIADFACLLGAKNHHRFAS